MYTVRCAADVACLHIECNHVENNNILIYLNATYKGFVLVRPKKLSRVRIEHPPTGSVHPPSGLL